MHRIKVFKTSDGRLFENEAEAAKHEATIKIHDWAMRHKISAMNSMTWDQVAKAMIEDAPELAYALSTVSQSLPSYHRPAKVNEISPVARSRLHS